MTPRNAESRTNGHPAPPPPRPVKYANLQSRLLLKKSFELQFVVPLVDPPRLSQAFVDWFGRRLMYVDISQITVDRPIVLIGLPRSGTTVLQDLVCAHPDVAYITNAMHAYRRSYWAVERLRKRFRLDFTGERFLGDGVMVGPGTPAEGTAFLADWLKIDPWSLEYVQPAPDTLSAEEVEKVHTAIRKMIWCHGGQQRRFFIKNPALVPHAAFISQLFPGARIIHVVRDPRMCANSMIKLYRRHRDQEAWIRSRLGQSDDGRRPFVPYPRLPNLARYVEEYGAESIWTTAHVWDDAISMVNAVRDQVPCLYELRYEDLVADPRKEVARLMEFCELDEVGDPGAAFWQKVGELRVIPPGREYREFEVVEEVCSANMRRYGYL